MSESDCALLALSIWVNLTDWHLRAWLGPPPEVVSLANFMQHVDENFEEPIAVEQTPRRFELLAEQQKDTKRGQTISLRP